MAELYGWSLNFFVRKINTTPGLLNELKQKADYNTYQRHLTPLQVQIIKKYLGDIPRSSTL